MKKKLGIIILTFVLTLSCLAGLCACNGRLGDNLDLRTGSRPNHSSIIGQDDLNIINVALSDTATEEEKKSAVIALFDIANYSRQNTEISLMLQSSDAGISMGDVIMHGFNLKNGDSWYYQLAVQATSTIPLIGSVIGDIAGLLKIAYTTGDGNYYYTVISGSKPECDCTIETFPYATFVVTQEPVLYNEEQFKKEMHYLNSMHEINNMKFCADIIADGAEITYNAQERFYTVKFSVDMEADEDLLKDWYALPKEDMAVGGQTLEKYTYYDAVLEVWDNGYAKSFKSSADRKAGMGSGSPIDKFEYLWNENEILALLKEDESIDNLIHSQMHSIEDYIEYYSNPELVAARLSKLKIAGIVIGSIIGAALLGIIIAVIVVETMLKQGKLPKLAAKREAKKQKRLEKKARRASPSDAKVEGKLEETGADNIDSCAQTDEISVTDEGQNTENCAHLNCEDGNCNDNSVE